MNEVIEKKIIKSDRDRGMRTIAQDLNDYGKEKDWTYNLIPWED